MASSFYSIIESRKKHCREVKQEALAEAKQLSTILRERFTFESIYLCGSILSDSFRPKSDIDIIIKGLPIEDFFKAYALLLKESRFQIDLKPFEDMTDDYQEKILKRGKRIE
jgi:predicted nucleotidyltransferase